MQKQKNTSSGKYLKILFLLMLIIPIVMVFRIAFSPEEKSVPEEQEKEVEESIIYPFINADEVEQMRVIDSAILLDIRDSGSFSELHIPFSKNIRPESLAETLKEAGEDMPIILIGYSSDDKDRTFITYNTLNKEAQEKIQILRGGFGAWQEAYLPTISSGTPGNILDQAKVRYVSLEELSGIVKQPSDVSETFFLDVRDEGDFQQAHTLHSHNIPLADIESRISEIPRHRVVFVYGETGLESFQSGVRLSDLGRYEVFTYKGGYKDLPEYLRP